MKFSLMKKAIVLLSGGLDSTTVLAIAKKQGFLPYALSFSYGQRHSVELELARKVAFEAGCEHRIANIDLGVFGGSALTDFSIEVPKGGQENQGSIPITYVPARNTIFLSYALAYAEVVGAFDIFIGVNAVDYSGYPDCRPAFIDGFAKLANLATASGISGSDHFRIHAPLLHLSKKEIIEEGMRLGVDYGKTHSCYDPITKDEKIYACGKCDSCYLRLEGFAAARIKDPAFYL